MKWLQNKLIYYYLTRSWHKITMEKTEPKSMTSKDTKSLPCSQPGPKCQILTLNSLPTGTKWTTPKGPKEDFRLKGDKILPNGTK